MDRSNAPAPAASPVDLEIRVSTQGKRLEFIVTSPSGAADCYDLRVVGPEISSPEAVQEKLLDQLSKLRQGYDVDEDRLLPDDVPFELLTIGQDFYQALFPRELQRIYRENRDRIETLLITSDEPWIPWEILHPAEEEGDDFLCMKHRMTRWLSGDVPLAGNRSVRRALCLEPGAEERKIGRECGFLKALEERIPGLKVSVPSGVDLRVVLRLLEEESFDLLHFAGHGQHDSERPGEAKIEVKGRRNFRARQLSPAARGKLRHERPIVFFNSCESGRTDRSVLQLDGWAPRWIQRYGCSAFLAPVWAVRDSRAQRFSEVFYGQVLAGQTIGAAVHRARHALRQEEPGEMAWLAYRVYGPAGARVGFGDAASEAAHEGEQTPTQNRTSETASPFSVGDLPTTSRRPTPKARAGRAKAMRIAVTVLAVISLGLILATAWDLFESVPSRDSDQVPEILPSSEPPGGSETGEDKNDGSASLKAGAPTVAEPETVVEKQPPPPSQQDLAHSFNDDKADNVQTFSEPLEGLKNEGGKEDGSVSLKTTPSVTEPEQGAETQDPPRPRRQESFPFQSLVPGKVAVFVSNSRNGKNDPGIAYAILQALSETTGNPNIEIPRGNTAEDPSLVLTEIQTRTPDGSTPWGAEFLLIARGSTETLTQSAAHIRSVSLTLGVQLVRASDGTPVLNSQDTHNGAAITVEGALQQAAARCLRPISNQLNQGEV